MVYVLCTQLFAISHDFAKLYRAKILDIEVDQAENVFFRKQITIRTAAIL